MKTILSIAAILIQTALSFAQNDSMKAAFQREFLIDGGIPLSKQGISGHEEWFHQYSVRIGLGTSLEKRMLVHLFVEYDKYLINTRWGDLTARVFQNEYPRHDLALYVALTFSRWLIIGAGGAMEFKQDMIFINVGPNATDTTKHTIESTSIVSPFIVVGFKYDMPLTEHFFMPVGVYFNGLQPLYPISRIGLSKRF